MFKHYFKIAGRNLWRNKGFSAITIFGLAIGLATCLLITLFIVDELSYDRYNVNADQIYRVDAHIRVNGSSFNSRVTPAALGSALLRDYPAIENMARIRGGGGKVLVKKGNHTLMEPDCFWADSTLFDVFTLPMISGNPKTALTQPHSIVLSRQMAMKYFNSTDVVGKTLLLDNTTTVKITGVIEDMPAESHLHFHFIRAMSGLAESRSDFWLNNNFVTYVLARPGTDEKTIDHYLQQAALKYAQPQLENLTHNSFHDLAKDGGYFEYKTIPLTKIHLYSTITTELEPSGNIQYVYIFIVIAIIILLIACVNFTNLSTARSAGRSREVGIRKVMGSQRSSLVSQFLMESIMTSFLAMGLAVLIAVLLLPYFNRLSGKSLTIGLFSNYWLVPGLLFTAVIVGLLAGSYPAFFLSAFRPTDVLKGKLSTGFKNGWLRNGLVIFQFATAIILIVGTLVIYSQLNFIRHKDLGYNRQQVLVLRNIYSLGTHWSTFKDEVLQIQGVTAGTIAGTLPISERYNSNAFSKDAALSAGLTTVMGQWEVGADYIPTLGMRMVKGRNFSLDMPTDSSAIIINQTAARMLGLKAPINKRLYQWDQGSHPVSYHIIGVVHDFNTGSLRNKIAPIVFNLAVNRSLMAFRINTKNTAAVVAKIKDKYQAITGMAGQPFVYSFMNADYNKLYWSEERTGELFIYFALFAILLACLGLFGLVTYAAKRRTKEVGIRKVLGASVGVIVKHLSLDFLKLVMVATVIAIPVAWWAMNRWLQDFAYRTTIHWWVFLLAGALVLLIALITVSFQAIKAAVANPVKSLRTE